ncbi:MAG: hypothetical protein GC162_06095 [Planctomycetes bacterium]|nr:hypothetical protein [Planctomycetota bacterium]
MKFKLDENIPIELKAQIAADGHDVHTLHDEQLVGVSDADLMKRIVIEQRVLLTLDKGIADIRHIHPPNIPVWCCFGPMPSDDSSSRDSSSIICITF